MSIPYGLLIEGLVVVLLVVTVFYCISLEGKLRALRSDKDELKSIIQNLNKATENAQSSVYHLKAAGAQTANDLSDLVSNARILSDELELMIGSGKNLADRLEGARAPSVNLAERRAANSEKMSNTEPRVTTPLNEEDLLKSLREAR